MGWQFLRRSGSNPTRIGFHLILGVAGLEMLLRGAPNGSVAAAGSLGKSAVLGDGIYVVFGVAF